MQKSKDSKGRWRNRTVAFRVSQREWEMIDGMVSLSGLQKQDYILRKLMDWEVTIQGSSRIYKALKVQMDKIYQELKRLETGERPDEDLLTTLQMVALTLNGMKENHSMQRSGSVSEKKKMSLLVTRTFSH